MHFLNEYLYNFDLILKFHWNLFLWVNFTIMASHWIGSKPKAGPMIAICLNQPPICASLIYICESLTALVCFLINFFLLIFIQLKIGIYIHGLVQDWSIYIANALELLQSCTKPSIWNDDSSVYTNTLIFIHINPSHQNTFHMHILQYATSSTYDRTFPHWTESI